MTTSDATSYVRRFDGLALVVHDPATIYMHRYCVAHQAHAHNAFAPQQPTSADTRRWF